MLFKLELLVSLTRAGPLVRKLACCSGSSCGAGPGRAMLFRTFEAALVRSVRWHDLREFIFVQKLI